MGKGCLVSLGVGGVLVLAALFVCFDEYYMFGICLGYYDSRFLSQKCISKCPNFSY